MSEDKSSEPQPITLAIEGFVHLQQGSNFYDQPPFDRFLQTASEQSALDLPYLRQLLTRFVKRFGSQPSLAGDQGKLIPSERPGMLGRELVEKHDRPRPDFEAVGTAMRSIVTKLALFPNWQTYVSSKLRATDYRENGDFVPIENRGYRTVRAQQPRNVVVTPTLSYMAWLEDTQTRGERLERNARIQVITEAFPQQLGGQTTADAVAQSGGSSERRRWQLRTRPPR